MESKIEDLAVAATAEVTRPEGSLDLSDYPLLVQAGLPSSVAVRTEDNGTHVGAIAARARAIPDVGALAFEFRTTTEHVRQALAYVTTVDTESV